MRGSEVVVVGLRQRADNVCICVESRKHWFNCNPSLVKGFINTSRAEAFHILHLLKWHTVKLVRARAIFRVTALLPHFIQSFHRL